MIDSDYKRVQEHIDILTTKYKINQSLKHFDIIHMYPKRLAYPEGYIDSMFFDLHLFNTETMEKRIIESRDELSFESVAIRFTRIYADGSTMFKFKHCCKIDIFQSSIITGI